MSDRHARALRARLMAEHPFCVLCDCRLVNDSPKDKRRFRGVDNGAVLLRPSMRVKLDIKIADWLAERSVLACRGCVNTAANAAVKAIPIEQRRRAARRYPVQHRNDGEIAAVEAARDRGPVMTSRRSRDSSSHHMRG